MWSPTHVLLTVHRARNLLTKGKHGTNDAFVTIALGKEKYQTSVKEKVGPAVEWHEECELPIPKQGNTAEIVLTALHRNFLGVDEFLGTINIPLADFDFYEKARCKWYTLKSRPGKEKKDKDRGELEVKVTFIVKAGSLTDLRKKEKHKSSLGQLAQSVGGSLLSIGTLEKRKGLKKLAKNFGNKLSKNRKDKDGKYEEGENDQYESSQRRIGQIAGEADPGVISEDEDEFTFDDLSHKSSGSSLNITQGNTTATSLVGSLENLAGGEVLRRSTIAGSTNFVSGTSPPAKPPRITVPEKPMDEWQQKLTGKRDIHGSTDLLKRRNWDTGKQLFSQPEEQEPEESEKSPSSKKVEEQNTVVKDPEPERKEEREKENELSKLAKKIKNFRREPKSHAESTPPLPAPPHHEERIIIGGENTVSSSPQAYNYRLPPEIIKKYEGKSREDLIEMVCAMQSTLDIQNRKVKDLEDYLDNLLLRVMETTPRILQNPYVNCKTQAKLRSWSTIS